MSKINGRCPSLYYFSIVVRLSTAGVKGNEEARYKVGFLKVSIHTRIANARKLKHSDSNLSSSKCSPCLICTLIDTWCKVTSTPFKRSWKEMEGAIGVGRRLHRTGRPTLAWTSGPSRENATKSETRGPTKKMNERSGALSIFTWNFRWEFFDKWNSASHKRNGKQLFLLRIPFNNTVRAWSQTETWRSNVKLSFFTFCLHEALVKVKAKLSLLEKKRPLSTLDRNFASIWIDSTGKF